MNTPPSPLVSIIVVTYNSSNYVLETLESVKLQTYQNIELIITDDSSQDNTIEICKNWLIENKERFIRTELITSEKNLGISSNCNRGVKSSSGEWVKFIGGDDILLDSNIEDNVGFANNFEKCYVITSKSTIFYTSNNKVFYSNTIPSEIKNKFYNLDSNAKDQFEILKYGNKVNAPTSFFSRVIFQEITQFDEEFKLIEDYPMWLNLTKSGIKIFFLDKVTVNYRLHDSNIYQNSNNYLYNKFYFDLTRIRLKYCQNYYSISYIILLKYEYFIRKILKLISLDKPNIYCKIIDRILTFYTLKEWLK